MEKIKNIFSRLRFLFLIVLVLGFGIPFAISQTSGPTVVVTVLNDKIGSSLATPHFTLNVQVQDSSSIQNLSLTAQAEGGGALFGPAPILALGGLTSPAPCPINFTLTSNQVGTATGIVFSSGVTYDFTVQATDTGSLSNTGADHLDVDNSPPQTTFFFTGSAAQSYPSQEDWSAGVLTGTNVVGVNPTDAVILAGPVALVSQPLGNGYWNQYNFNQPNPVVAGGTGVLAISTPTYNPSLLAVNTTVSFQQQPPGVLTNVFTQNIIDNSNYYDVGGINEVNPSAAPLGAYTQCNTSQTLNPFSLNPYPRDQIHYDDIMGGVAEVDYAFQPGGYTSSTMYCPDNQQYFSPDWIFGPFPASTNYFFNYEHGAPWIIQNESATGDNRYTAISQTNFHILKMFNPPVFADRVIFDTQIYRGNDPSNAPPPCGGKTNNVDTFYDFQIKLKDSAGNVIVPGGLTFDGEIAPSDIGGLSPVDPGLELPAYYSSTALAEPENIASIEISGSGSAYLGCYNNGAGILDGPKIVFNQVAGYAPVTDTNPILVNLAPGGDTFSSTSNPNWPTAPCCSDTLNPNGYFSDTFTHKQTGAFSLTFGGSFLPVTYPGYSGTSEGSVTRTLPSPKAVHDIVLQNVGAGANLVRLFKGTPQGGADDLINVFRFTPEPSKLILTLDIPGTGPLQMDISNFNNIGVAGNIKTARIKFTGLVAYLNVNNQMAAASALQSSINTLDETVKVNSISVSISAPALSDLHFGNCFLYGVPGPAYAGGGASAPPALFTSPVFDLGLGATSDPRPYFLSWAGSIPTGTSMVISVRSSKTDSTLASSSWQLLANNVPTGNMVQLPMLGHNIGDRWFQYQVAMNHTVLGATPVLQSVALVAGQYTTPGLWTSLPLDLGSGKFSIPPPYPPTTQAVASWRSKFPTATSMTMYVQTSLDSWLWSLPAKQVFNGVPFSLPTAPPVFSPPSGNHFYVMFDGILQTNDPDVSPELHNLDFTFEPFCVSSAVASGSSLFFTPIDSNSGIAQELESIFPVASSPSYSPYSTPFTPFSNGVQSGVFKVSGYGQDYAGNVETPVPATQVQITNFALGGARDGEFTNKNITPTLSIDPNLSSVLGTLQVLEYQVVSGVTGSPTDITSQFAGGTGTRTGTTINQSGSYILVAQITPSGASCPLQSNLSFRIFNQKPPQPTGLVLNAGGSSNCAIVQGTCAPGFYCVSWNPWNNADALIDPFFIGFNVYEDGVLLTGTPITGNAISLPQGFGDHTFQIVAVDSLGNVSAPAEISTIPNELLVTDSLNNRIFLLNECTGLIDWMVPPTGNTGSQAFTNPISAGQVGSTDHIDFGKELTVDTSGGWLVDTTAFPGYTGLNSLTSPDARLAPHYANPTGVVISQVEKTYDGNYLVCSNATGGGTGTISKVAIDPTTNAITTTLWTITGFTNPTSVRELSDTNLLIADPGLNLVVEVTPPNSGSSAWQSLNIAWQMDNTFTPPLASPNAATQGKESQNFYISDTGHHQIVVLDPAHSHPVLITTFNGTNLVSPQSAEELQTGNLEVADSGLNKLLGYQIQGTGAALMATPLTSSPISPYTGSSPSLNKPFDVREVRPPYRIDEKDFASQAFLDNPFAFKFTITDIHGNPVPNYTLTLSTDGTFASFVPPGVFISSPSINPNTLHVEGTVNFSANFPTVKIVTNPGGQAVGIYYPTAIGPNPVTVFGANNELLILNPSAIAPDAIPAEPSPPPPVDFFSQIADIVLSVVSLAADTFLDTVTGGAVQFNIMLSMEGVSFAATFDGLTAGWSSKTGFYGSLGITVDGLQVAYSTQGGFTASATIPGIGSATYSNGNFSATGNIPGVGSVNYTNGNFSVSGEIPGVGTVSYSDRNGFGGSANIPGVGSASYSQSGGFGVMANIPGFGNAGYSTRGGFVAGTTIPLGDGLPPLNLAASILPNGQASIFASGGPVAITANSHGINPTVNTDWIAQQVADQIIQGITGDPGGNQNTDPNNVTQTTQQCPSCPTGGNNPVDTSIGLLLYASTDVNVPGPAPKLTMQVNRVYDNRLNFTGSFGPHWTFEYDTYLLAGPLNWTLYFGDGHIETFKRNMDGIHCTPIDTNRTSILTFDSGAQQWTYTDKFGNQYLLNSLGRVITESDRLGNQINCSYDSNHLLSTVSDSTGRNLTFTYANLDAGGNPNGYRLTKFTDPLGRVFQYKYSPFTVQGATSLVPTYSGGDLLAVLLPDGRKISYTYSSDDLLASYDDPHQGKRNKTYSYQYDGKDRVVEETDSLGYSTDFTYAASGRHDGAIQTTEVTNARGYTTTDTCDAYGHWTKRVDGRDGVTSFTYDKFGNRLSETNALTNTMSFTYDSNNNKASQTDPMGNSINMTYDPQFSQLTTITNALNKTWNLTYDSQGNLIGVQDPLTHSWGFTYFSYGRLASTTNQRGFTTNFTRDGNGLLTSGTDPLGNVEHFQYDNVGRLASQTDPAGNKTQFTYDPGDYLTQVTYQDGSTKAFNYNSRGDLASQTDENGHATQYTYDTQDQLLTMTDACGGKTISTYDPVGNLATTTDKAGNLWTMSYNENNWPSSVFNQDGGTHNFEYDAVGNKLAWTDSEGHTIQGQYDADNRLAQLTDANGKTMPLTRDPLERASAITDKNGNTTQYFFDDSGRSNQIVDSNGGQIHINRDEMGNFSSVSDQLGHATTVIYGADNRATTLIRPEGDKKVYTYNPNGLWQTAQIAGCSCGTKTYGYSPRNLVTGITDEAGGQFQFGYDKAGNQNQLTDAGGFSTSYGFDACDRAVKKTGPAGDLTQWTRDLNGRIIQMTDPVGNTFHYQYNQLGNPTGVTDAKTNPWSFTYNKMGAVTSSTDGNHHTTSFLYDSSYHLLSKTDALNNTTGYLTDSMGYLAQMTDADGHNTYYQRDALSRLTQVTAGNLPPRLQAFDAANRLMTSTDENTNTTHYFYDKNNRPVSQVDPLNNSQIWTYDARDKVLTSTDQNSHTTTNTYDTLGRLHTSTDAENELTTYNYDSVGNITSITDPNSHTTHYRYDGNRRRVAVTDALGNQTQSAYDPLGRLVQVTDALGFSTQYLFDPNSHLIKKTDPLGGITQYQYDAFGHQVETIDPNGNPTQFQYDADNRRTKTIDAKNGVLETDYDAVGNIVGTIDPNGNAKKYTFDSVNRRVQMTDAEGGSTSSQHDGVGNLTVLTDPNGNSTQFGYDADNRKSTMTDARGGLTGYQYDGVGGVTQVIDAKTNSTLYAYDKVNRPVTVTNADTFSTIYQYDPVGNRMAIIDANNHSTSYQYDVLNRLLSETDAIGNFVKSGFDAVGNVISKTDSKGTRVMKYDGNHRLVEDDLTDGKKINNSFDAGSRVTQVTDWNGNYQFAYDQLNRLSQKTVPGGKTIKHTYDAAGNETARTDFLGGKYTYHYDTINRAVQVTDPLGGITGITYDKTKNVLQYHYPNNTSVVNTYDPTYDILSTVNKKDSGEVINQFKYQYDAVGNKKNVTDNLGETAYGYDNIYQLTSVQYPERPAESYTYDPVGNRLTMTVGTQTNNYSHNNANMMLSAGAENLTYDGNGNLVKKVNGSQTTQYAYDTENHLAQVTLPDSTKSIFGYDYTGLRISDTEPLSNGSLETKQFFWNDNDVVNEESPKIGLSYNVLNGMNLSKSKVGQGSTNSQVSYYHFDALGSVADTADSGGNVLGNYRYDAFGETLSNGQGNDNDLQFVGALGVRNQSKDGLIYMRNRWYDPQLGVFLEKDPARSDLEYSLFNYSRNNPINSVDPLGLYSTKCITGDLDFIFLYFDFIDQVAKNVNTDPDFLIAQSSYETGWGQAESLLGGNNLWGLRKKSSFYTFATIEDGDAKWENGPWGEWLGGINIFSVYTQRLLTPNPYLKNSASGLYSPPLSSMVNYTNLLTDRYQHWMAEKDSCLCEAGKSE